MKRLVALLLGILLVGACQREPEPGRLRVDSAWVRLAPVRGQPAAAYFTIRGGDRETRLEAVTSPEAQRVELHESRTEGGMSRMRPVADVSVPAGGELAFAPGGRHAMLFGLSPEVQPFGRLPLHFRFSGEELRVHAFVVTPGVPAPEFVDALPPQQQPACEPGMRKEGEKIIITNCSR